MTAPQDPDHTAPRRSGAEPAACRRAQAAQPHRVAGDVIQEDAPTNAKVKFEIAAETNFGEAVAMVGSFKGWDPAKPLSLEWSEGNMWQGEAEVPAGKTLEYKYIRTSEADGTVAWQPGNNMVLELSDEAVLVLDDWLGRQHKVQPLAVGQLVPAEAERLQSTAALGGAAAVRAAEPEVPVAELAAVDGELSAVNGGVPAAEPGQEKKQVGLPAVAPVVAAVKMAAVKAVEGKVPLLLNKVLSKPAAAAPKPKLVEPTQLVAVRRPAVAAKPAATAVQPPAMLQATAAGIKADAMSMWEQAPSAAIPVVAVIVAVVLLVASGFVNLCQSALAALHFTATLERS